MEFQPTDFQGDTPKVYRVVLLDNKRIEIHPSRCTVIHGKIVPDILQGIPIRERFFGMPALKACEQSLKNLANVVASAPGFKVKIHAPFSRICKSEIVKLGRKIGVDYEKNTWSCYRNGKNHCGKCDSCLQEDKIVSITAENITVTLVS